MESECFQAFINPFTKWKQWEVNVFKLLLILLKWKQWEENVFKLLLILLKGKPTAEHSGKLNTAKPHPRQDFAYEELKLYSPAIVSIEYMTIFYPRQGWGPFVFYCKVEKHVFSNLVLADEGRGNKTYYYLVHSEEWQNIPRTSSLVNMTKLSIFLFSRFIQQITT